MATDKPGLFIIDLHYLKPVEVIDALMKDHMVWVDRGYEDGVFLISGRKNPRTGGIIIAAGMSREDVEKRAAEDPFVVEGAAKVEITRFEPSRVSDGFRDLFAKG